MRISLILTLDYTSWEHQSLTKLICVNSKFTWWVKSSCGCRVEIESHLPTYLLPSPISSKSQPSISSWWAPSCFQIWEISPFLSLSLSLSLSLPLSCRSDGGQERPGAPSARPGAPSARPAHGQARPGAPSARPARGQARPARGQGPWPGAAVG